MPKQLYNEFLRESVRKYFAKPCMHIKRQGKYQDWTYGDFQRDCNNLVSMLEKSGFAAGTHGIVIGENIPEWVIAYHAIILAGGCTVPIDPNLPGDEIHEIVRVTEPRVIFCSLNFLPFMQDMKGEFPCIRDIILLDQQTAPDAAIKTFSQCVALGSPETDAFQKSFSPDHPVAVLFTSGTTGKAKGAVLTMKNFSIIGPVGAQRMHLTAEHTMVAVLPLYHVFGFAGCIIAPLCIGMNIVFVPEIKGPLILQALNDKKVTALPAVPKMLSLFYDNIGRTVRQKGIIVRIVFQILKCISFILGPFLGMGFRARLFSTVHKGFGGHLTKIISGGAALEKRCFNGFRLMGFNIVEGYGLTETFGPITLCPITRPRLGSVGPVLPENEVLIAHPDASGVGEVLLRGACVFNGYYKNEAATSAVFDSDGWFHSGDLGRLDKKGFLYLCGRSKDVIVLESGKNVYPDELEDFYCTSGAIEEVGIFGLQVKEKEIVAAVIVPSAEIRKKYPLEKAQDIIHNELIRMNSNRPTYKKITDSVVSYSPLPRTSTKKIKKHELKTIYNALKKSPHTSLSSSVKLSAVEEKMMTTKEFKTIADCIFTLLKNKPDKLTPKTNLETDCGIDSLKFIEIISSLEECFGISIPEEMLSNIITLADLHALIMQNAKETGDDVTDKRLSFRQRIATAAGIKLDLSDNNGLLLNAGSRLATGLTKMLWNVTVRRHSALPENKPLLFISNHQSYIDVVWILSSLPGQIRKKTYTIGKNELLRTPLLAPVLKRCNFVPIQREGDMVEVMKKCIAVIRNNKNLIIFPEGTRTLDGTIQGFKSGIGLLILETNVTVIPIKIKGSFELWGRDRLPKLFRTKIQPTVTFGAPVTYQELIDKELISPHADEDEITAQIRRIIENL